MSIEINWEALTTGPDGVALAESIREFIHDRFQQVPLPKFIHSVRVHSFDFGSVAPELDLKDICDPLPDFYEGEDDDEADDDEDDGTPASEHRRNVVAPSPTAAMRQQTDPQTGSPLPRSERTRPRIDTARPSSTTQAQAPHLPLHSETLNSFLSRASTPGIPGGTSNINNYFHLPLSAGLNGTQTPFAAVAQGWPDRYQGAGHGAGHDSGQQQYFGSHSPTLDSRTASALPTPQPSVPPGHRRRSSSYVPHQSSPLRPEDAPPTPPPLEDAAPETSVNDVQIVAHLRYSGDIKMSLTADILLDYPMPSFVGIPLQLRVTGLAFDGVAILAYIKRKAHFCFLAPEDADALVGGNPRSPAPEGKDVDAASPVVERATKEAQNRTGGAGDGERDKKPVGGLFEEIHIESEIGQQAGPKPVLKNVGKVEKFVLEQVRRIFETEFVYPSFWTFLV